MTKVYSSYRRRILRKISTRYKSKIKCTKNIMNLLNIQDDEKYINLILGNMNMIIQFYDILLKEHNKMRETIGNMNNTIVVMQKSISDLQSKLNNLNQ